MPIVLFNHAGAATPKLLRDYHERDAARGEPAGIGVARLNPEFWRSRDRKAEQISDRGLASKM